MTSIGGAIALAAHIASPTDPLNGIPAQDYYSKREQWASVNGTSSNVSHFAYLDRNENGSFDSIDRPLAGIAVKLTRPDNSGVVKRSNLNGFVNFSNSAESQPVDVAQPGRYTMDVMVPQGWHITSANKVQHLTYTTLPESRPGLIADSVPTPAGLLPRRYIAGRATIRDDQGELRPESGAMVTVTKPDRSVTRERVGDDGRFTVPAARGKWSIAIADPSGRTSCSHDVVVTHTAVQLGACVLNEADPSPNHLTTTIDFESITPQPIAKMPNGLGGVSWSNLIVVDNSLYGGDGYINTTQSGRYVAYNSSGYPVTLTSTKPFTLVSVYVGAAWLESEGEILTIQAWRGYEKVAIDQLTLSAISPVRFDAHYQAITRLELTTMRYWQFVIDDIVLAMPVR